MCVGVCLPLLLSGIVAGWLVFEVSCFGRRWFADVVVRRIAWLGLAVFGQCDVTGQCDMFMLEAVCG